MVQTDAVKLFIDQIRWLYEPEYGDFKRKVNLYIERLEEAEPSVKNGAGEKVLASMRSIVVYSPNGDIESTRREVIQLAAQLLSATGGPLH